MNTPEAGTTIIDRATGATAPYRLVFPHGVANLNIRVDGSMPEPYRGEFYGPKPRVSEADGVISIDYPRFNALIWGRTSADVMLSPSVSWRIEVRSQRGRPAAAAAGGYGADSRDRRSEPSSAPPPGGVPARVHIWGGASKLELDTQYLGAIGGPGPPETPGYVSGTDPYHAANR